MEAAGNGESVCPDDVYPDAWELRLCCEFSNEAGTRGLERVGLVYIHGVFARMLVDHVSLVHMA